MSWRKQVIARSPAQQKSPAGSGWAFLLHGCLTMTYFRARLRTIIGVLPFHGPVRDGKGWCRQAMVVRRWRVTEVREQGTDAGEFSMAAHRARASVFSVSCYLLPDL